MRPGLEYVRRTLLKEIRDTPATRDYQRRIDTRVEADLERQSAQSGFVLPPGERAWFDPAELMTWDARKRKRLARDAPWLWYYELGRRSAEALGRFAFAYRSPLSRFYREPLLLDRVRRGLLTYREHLSPEGEFIFCPVRYADVFGPHEQAWRLEPLIYAYVWIEDELPVEERRSAWEMFEQAAGCLHRRRRPGETNNRGAVWCAVMALAGRLLGKDEYLEAARASWEEVRSILSPDGQVLEGGGPDDNYSFTAMSYIYLYRVWSGDASLDEPMVRALRWFAKWHSRSGYAFGGMATRKRRPVRLGLADLIAPLERFARSEPFFRTLASRYLALLDRHSPGTGGGHGCSPFIWAMLEHEPGETPGCGLSEPSWFSGFAEEYRTSTVRYVLVRRSFQTAVTLRASQGLNGLQTWAWGEEPPIVAPGRAEGSATRGWGLDTALLPVSTHLHSTHREQVVWSRGEPIRLSFRQGALWTHCLFGEVTTLVVFQGPGSPRVTTWCCNLRLAPEPFVGEGVVAFPGLEGRLHFVGEPPTIRRTRAPGTGEPGAAEDPLLLLDFEAPDGGLVPFAFTDSSFAWEVVDRSRGVFAFRDRAGRVRVELGRAPGFDAWPSSSEWSEMLRVQFVPAGSASSGPASSGSASAEQGMGGA